MLVVEDGGVAADAMQKKKKKQKDVMMSGSYSCESRLKVFFFLKSFPHLLSAGHVVQKSSHLLCKDEGQQRAVLSCLYSIER